MRGWGRLRGAKRLTARNGEKRPLWSTRVADAWETFMSASAARGASEPLLAPQAWRVGGEWLARLFVLLRRNHHSRVFGSKGVNLCIIVCASAWLLDRTHTFLPCADEDERALCSVYALLLPRKGDKVMALNRPSRPPPPPALSDARPHLPESPRLTSRRTSSARSWTRSTTSATCP